ARKLLDARRSPSVVAHERFDNGVDVGLRLGVVPRGAQCDRDAIRDDLRVALAGAGGGLHTGPRSSAFFVLCSEAAPPPRCGGGPQVPLTRDSQLRRRRKSGGAVGAARAMRTLASTTVTRSSSTITGLRSSSAISGSSSATRLTRSSVDSRASVASGGWPR